MDSQKPVVIERQGVQIPETQILELVEKYKKEDFAYRFTEKQLYDLAMAKILDQKRGNR